MKKFLTILFTLWICSICTICAFADTVLKGKTFDSYTDFSAGQASTSAPKGYVYAGYRVEQVNNLYSTVTNLFVLETETPMILHYTQGNSGYTISIPGGTYYKNYITYDKNGERNKSETPTKQNATSFAIGSNMAFYPALKMVNSSTGEEINPETSPVYTLHAFVDSDSKYHFSVSCDNENYDFSTAQVHFYHINGTYNPPFSASYDDVGSYGKPVSFSSIATNDSQSAYYDKYFNQFYVHSLMPILNASGGDVSAQTTNSQGFVYLNANLSSSSFASSNFEPDLYSPYQDRGVYRFDSERAVTAQLVVNVKSLLMHQNNSYFPSADTFGLVAVIEKSGSDDVVLYYTFSRSAVLAVQGKWIVAPINAPTIEEPEEPVSDLQQLAEYLKYLASVNTVNNTTIYNNYMSELNDMPWNDYVYGGLKLWMPELSNEFSNLANNFGTTNFTLSDDDLVKIYGWHDDLDERIEQKFAWREVITDEVSFIYTSVLDSGSNPPVFQITLNRWGLTEPMQIVDFSEVDEGTHTKIKDFITVFMSISLCVYIFRSLPSTIGNEPE